MRPYGILIGIALAAGSINTHAMDMNRVRQALSKVDIAYTWQSPNEQIREDQKALTAIGLTLDDNTGEFRFFRTDDNKEISSYNIRIKEISKIAAELKLETKSSTCERIKPGTKCSLHFRIPRIGYELVPIRGAKPDPVPANRSLEILEASTGFIAKYLPEIAPLNSVHLSCNDWSWATSEGSKKAVFIEVSSIISNTVEDLNRSVPSQSTFFTNLNCNIRKQSCLIESAQPSSNALTMIQAAAFTEGLAFETAEGEGSCTTEFKGEGAQNLIELFNSTVPPSAGPEYNTPAFLKKIQSRLDRNFIEEYRKERLAEMLMESSPYLPSIALMLDYTWLQLFDLIDTRGGSTSCPEDKCIFTINVMDKFNGRDGN